MRVLLAALAFVTLAGPAVAHAGSYFEQQMDSRAPPTEYHARVEWEARRSGKPPTVVGGHYNIPTEYHAREKQAAKYRAHAKRLRGR